MEMTKTMLPIRTTDQLQKQSEQLLMQCYEQENGTNCYGHTPRRSANPDYLRAKRKALQIAKKYKDTHLYLHLKANL
jgi:hypothetical protein